MSQTESDQPSFDAHNTAPGIRTAMAQVQAANVRRRELIATGRLDDSSAIVPLGPDSIPGYQVLREIHRGGQGIVYQAIQSSTGRKVALKIMKEGPFAGSGEHARFEREVRVLAQLDHPHIVAIHDSGSAAGCHYFVMNYIAGQPLDVYMAGASEKRQNVKTPTRQNESGGTVGLSVKSTLKLFLKICEAINAAHLRGIIHRDIKPSNIRVDENGEPHVLDFGLAKVALSGQPDVADGANPQSPMPNPFTLTGQFIGSLPWASPEQAQGAASKIDMRTDVYSLGVLLYQMLTGKFPYEVADNMREVLNRIVSNAPIRPRTLRRDIDDDMETITLKCLQKDRDRRYQTAGELARDVRRYLAGDPIEAKRDSLGYVVRKLFRRHWPTFGVAAAFVLVLVLGFAYAMHHSYRADQALVGKEQQRQRAESVGVFLKELLTLADPAKAKGEKLTVRDALDRAANRIDDGALRDQPLVEADVRFTIGSTYFGLGLYPQAEAQLRAADALFTQNLGAEDPVTLRTRSKHSEVFSWMSDYRQAVPLAESTLAAQRRTLGTEHPDTQQSMLILGQLLPWADSGRFAEAESLLKSVLEYRERTLGRNHIETARALHLLGEAYTIGAYREKAEPLHREALLIHMRVLGPEHPETLETEFLLASELVQAGRNAEAEPTLRRLLETRRRVLGADHLGTLGVMEMLGAALNGQRRYLEAEPLMREKLAALQRTVGPDHQDNVSTRLNLAVCLKGLGRYAEAEAVLREALDVSLRRFGPEHAETTIHVMTSLANSLELQHKDAEAEQIARQAVDIQRRQKPRPLVWQVERPIRRLIEILKGRGELNEALTLEQELIAFALQEARAPDASPESLHDAAQRLLITEFPALRDVPQALELATQANRRTDFRNATFIHTLAQAHVLSGDSARAKEVWERSFAQVTDERVRSGKLNSAARWLLSSPPNEPRDSRLALEFAVQANELTGNTNPAYLDTLALASHQTGDTAHAIEVQQKALSLLAAADPNRAKYEDRLREFQATSKSAGDKPQR